MIRDKRFIGRSRPPPEPNSAADATPRGSSLPPMARFAQRPAARSDIGVVSVSVVIQQMISVFRIPVKLYKRNCHKCLCLYSQAFFFLPPVVAPIIRIGLIFDQEHAVRSEVGLLGESSQTRLL
jgi:hypothetical protein